MYRSYYNLKKKPFEITTDPRFLWLGEQHKEALAALEYCIREEKSFLLLTGDVGTGKTALINGLIRSLDTQTIIAALPDPGLEIPDFFNFLADSLKMGRKFTGKGEFLANLRKFLLAANAGKRKVLLVIDEAQRLNHELLEEIRLLSNIELNNRKMINIFFVGQPEFNQLLLEPRNKAVRHRIVVRSHINPLTEEEIGKYIRHRLQIAGTNRKLFTKAAIHEIYAYSGGNPRLTNIICDHALLSGYTTDLKVIDGDVVKECARELRLPEEKREKQKKQKIAAETQPARTESAGRQLPVVSFVAVAIVAILVAAGGYYLSNLQAESTAPWSIDELIPKRPKSTMYTPTDKKKQPFEAATKKPPSEERPIEPAADKASIRSKPPQPSASQDSKLPGQVLDLANIEKIVIHFKHNSNELSDKAYLTLDRFAAALFENTGIDVTVKGYTDSSGSQQYNLSVSNFRANLIKSYLLGKGISPSRVTAVGMGSQNPMASNETAEGRQQNRRVEIEFIAKNLEDTEPN
jgi:general secretion pathway protein A